MIVSTFECKKLLEQSYNVLLPSNEKQATNMCTIEMNSDSSEQKYIHLSNCWYWHTALKFVTCLEYGYAQVTVDLFCENVTLAHCSVLVCNYVLQFFLYPKECVIISKFGSTVSCGLIRETKLTKYKPIAWRMHLLNCKKCSTLDGDPFTW